MTATRRKPIRLPVRVLSAVGPGDVVAAHDDWTQNVQTLSETSITFSSQEFEAFAKLGISLWAVSSNSRTAFKLDGENRIENRPKAGSPSSGLGYHVSQARYAISLLRSAVRFRATHAIVDSGTTHWFMLFSFRLFNIEIIPNFHNVPWPVGYPPRRTRHKMLLALDVFFFRSSVRVALGVSPECGRQVAWLCDGRCVFHDYRAQFTVTDFGCIGRPCLHQLPLRILFAGRVERSKGVFDLLEVCERLNGLAKGRFVFDVCGSGGALDELRTIVDANGANERFKLHGKLPRPRLLEFYAQCHLVIVPTRSDFCEGLPMVCAEAVLAGRPVVTSRMSNALEVLRGSVVEARENDVGDYVEKIVSLVNDPTRYEEMVSNTVKVRSQFLDEQRGLRAALTTCFMTIPR